MKVYRFMSMREFSKLSAGLILINRKSHASMRTDSIGFCFLPESVNCTDKTGYGYTVSPEFAIKFLSGIVSEDIFVEFETIEELTPSVGIYADPIGDYCDTITVDELCVSSYSRDTLRPLRYGFVTADNTAVEWYDFN